MPIPSLITDLSSTTASNSPAGSDAVGSPATVDDYFRSHAAIIRNESLLKSWEQRGDVPTYVGPAVFSLPGDERFEYYAGRRLKTFGATTNNATIHSTTYTGGTSTGVYVSVDGGGTLDASLTTVWVGLDPESVPVSPVVTSYLPLTGGEMAGNITLSGNDVYGLGVLTHVAEVDFGNTGSAKSISFTDGMNVKATVDADTVLTVVAPPGPGFYQLRLIQNAVGAHTVSFVNIVATRWLASATQPAFNNAANGETIVTIFYTGSFASSVQSAQKVGAA